MFKRKLGKAFKWVKKHVRPDIGLAKPFEEGQGPDFNNDNFYEMSDKVRDNLRVGLKITFKF